MQKVVKHVAIVSTIILFFIAAFSVTYFSGPYHDGESFSTFVGKAFSAGSHLPSQKAQISGRIKVTDSAIISSIKQNEVLTAVSGLNKKEIFQCIQHGCYDTDETQVGEFGAIIPNLEQAGKTYYVTGKTTTDYISNEGIVVKEGRSECSMLFDHCKGTLLVEYFCAGTSPSMYPQEKFVSCKCGCSAGACLECIPQEVPEPIIPPDLVVESINKDAYSKQCINSLQFSICNNGAGPLEDEFVIQAAANNKSVEIEYKFFEYPKLAPGECAQISEHKKLSVLAFGMALGTEHEVTLTLDTHENVAESDETNNALSNNVFAGKNYYFDEEQTKECDTFCHDSDGDMNIWEKGSMTYKYNDEIVTEQDFCGGENGVHLNEFFCKDITYYENIEKFSNPRGVEWWFNCLDVGAKCVDGACVPLEKNHLQCLDNEAGVGDFNFDPTFQGTIDYTSVDGEYQEIKDSCKDTEELKDVVCNYDNLKDTYEFSCYKYKTADGKGHVCENGACVPTDIDLEACEGPTYSELDPFKAQLVTETKLLGEKAEHYPYCVNFNEEVRRWYCDGVDAKDEFYNCFQNEGAYCLDGKCVMPDEDLMECEDTDAGLDYNNKGSISYVTSYGKENWNKDHCIDDDLLIEYFCVENENKIADPYSCQSEGKVCHNGACKKPDELLLWCEDADNGVDVNQDSHVKWTDEFGTEGIEGDCCLDLEEYAEDPSEIECEDKSTTVIEWYCSESKPKHKLVECPTGEGCYDGECLPKDDSLKFCGEDPDYPDKVVEVNEFGDKNIWNSWCHSKTTQKTPVCNQDLEVDIIKIECEEAEACNDATGQCEEYDPNAKEECIVDEDGTVHAIDLFGNEKIAYPQCDDINTLETPYCNVQQSSGGGGSSGGDAIPVVGFSDQIEWEEVECEQGYECNWKVHPDKCMEVNEDWVSCEGPTAPNLFEKGEITSSDKFGQPQDIEGYTQDFCLNGLTNAYDETYIAEFWCEGNELAAEEMKCPEGTICEDGACV